MNSVITFQEKFIEFQDLLIATTEIYIKFWKELLKDLPGYKELSDYGYQIATNLDNINASFDSMVNLTHTNTKAYVLYTLFLSMVAKDAISAQEKHASGRMLLDMNYMSKKVGDGAMEKYGGNGNSAIIIMSGNKYNLGTVKNANHELFEMLGYSKKDILGNNISVTMPELLGEVHYKFVQRYFTKNATSVSLQKERLVLPQNSHGVLVPCNLFVKLLPNLHAGIQFIGFVTKADIIDEFRIGDNKIMPSEVVIFLLDHDMKIHGFSQRFIDIMGAKTEEMNLHKYLESDQKFSISLLYPEIFTAENIHQMMSPEGFETHFSFGIMADAFASEISEFFGTSEDNNKNLTKNNTGETIEDMQRPLLVNIKIQDNMLLNGTLNYKVCTLLLERGSDNNMHQNQYDLMEAEREKKLKKELAAFEEEAVSVTTSSSCIFRLNYIKRLAIAI